MNRRFFAALALVVLMAPMAHADYHSDAIGVTFPDHLGQFVYQEVHQYPTAGGGVSVYYRFGDAVIDVYVYNADQSGIPDGPDSAQVQGQFAGSQNAALQTLRRSHGQVEIVHDGDIIRPGGDRGLAFRGSVYRFQSEGREHRSLLLVTGYHGNFIKIRATFPAGGRDDATRAVNDFVVALGALLSTTVPK